MNSPQAAPVLVSALFSGDALLSSIAADQDRISRTQHPTDPAVAKVQTALLTWSPSCLPKFGADGGYGDETAAAVSRFKIEVIGVPPAEVIDDVGPQTVINLDAIQAAAENPQPPPGPVPNATVLLRNEYGDPLPNLAFTVTEAGADRIEQADDTGQALLSLSDPARLTLDPSATVGVLGDLLDRPWPPPEPVEGVYTTPATDVPLELGPEETLTVVVASRLEFQARLATPFAGTPRTDGTGIRVGFDSANDSANDSENTVVLMLQANGGGQVSLLLDPEPELVDPAAIPDLTGWTPTGTYTVREGDTAAGLGLSFLGDPDRFAEISDHDPVPGESLPLPELPEWLSLATDPLPEPPVPQIWLQVSPDELLTGLYTDNPGPLHDLLTVLDRPPAMTPDPAGELVRRAEVLAAVLAVQGPPLGPELKGIVHDPERTGTDEVVA